MAGGTHVCATAKASNAPNSRNDSAGKIVKGVGSGQTRVRSNYWLEWPPKWLTRPTLRSHEAYVCIARTRKVSGPRMFRERGEFAADFKVFFPAAIRRIESTRPSQPVWSQRLILGLYK